MIIIDTKCIDGVYTPTDIKVEKPKGVKSRKTKKQIEQPKIKCEATTAQSPLEDFIGTFVETYDLLGSIARRL